MNQMVDASQIIESPSYNEDYVRYTIYGVPFDVPRRYTPPIEFMGRGTFGFVISMRDSYMDEKVAVKKVFGAFLQAERARALLREIRILRHLGNCEHIIGLCGVIRPPSIDAFNDVLLVMERMDTDLLSIIKDETQTLKDWHCKHFVYQILCGLKYMHSANIIHRDLKPGNLLVNLDCSLKICDFGLARRMSGSDAMTQQVVTLWYRAPELLLGSQEYTKAIDVWSVGCILMEILTRSVLFRGRDGPHQLRLIMERWGNPTPEDVAFLSPECSDYLQRQFPPHLYRRQQLTDRYPGLNPEALDLAERMLIFNPEQRISVVDALAHPYFQRWHKEEDEVTCEDTFNIHEYEQGQLADVPYYQRQIWEESCLLSERENE